MTSTYMMSSSSNIYYNNSNNNSYSNNSFNNFNNFTNYGLNYYNESTGSEFSDGYQSSISPDLSITTATTSCQVKNQYYQHEFYPQYSHQQLQHPVQNIKFTKKENFSCNYENLKFNGKTATNLNQNLKKNCGVKKLILDTSNTTISNKSVTTVAPEILKRRRTAANARERRRMNSLNFAFDK